MRGRVRFDDRHLLLHRTTVLNCAFMGGAGMLLIFRTAFVMLMLGLAVPVAADPYKDAQAAYDRGDYATALRLNKPLADQGHVHAQSNLGWMFGNGRGVPQNYAEAMKWFCLAADQGNAGAQFMLGVMFDGGLVHPG